MANDYYEILGVSREATAEEIEKAYRRQALKHHPDKNRGDAEAEKRFKVSAEAYDVLGDSEKRARYDRYGHAGLKGIQGRGFQNVEDIFSVFGDIFGGGSVFGDLFGSPSHASGANQGENLRAEVGVTFEEVAHGTTRVLTVRRAVACEECKGSGAKKGTAPTRCDLCGGAGAVQQPHGFFSIRMTCPQCHGQGMTIAELCRRCHGEGRLQQKQDIEVKIPAGIHDGSRIRMRGRGNDGPRGGGTGDLFVVVRLEAHEFFQRVDNDVLCEIPITFTQAALGAQVEVPTLRGKVRMTIPAGSQSGEILRLKGQGFPSLDGYGVGDALIRVSVEVPRKLSSEQEELLRQLAEIEETQVESKSHTFFERLKNYFE